MEIYVFNHVLQLETQSRANMYVRFLLLAFELCHHVKGFKQLGEVMGPGSQRTTTE